MWRWSWGRKQLRQGLKHAAGGKYVNNLYATGWKIRDSKPTNEKHVPAARAARTLPGG